MTQSIHELVALVAAAIKTGKQDEAAQEAVVQLVAGALQDLRRIADANERVADNLAILAFVTGQFDVGHADGVKVRDAVRDRAVAALGVRLSQFMKPGQP